MSNHLHLVVTDVRGRLPKFMREFLSESGKAIKLAVGTTRRVWSPERYSAVELLDRDAVERMLTYCQTNPTEAGLTMPSDWPGLTSANHKIGDVLRAEKPGFYFGANRPDSVSCLLSPIPRLIGELKQQEEELTPEAYRARCRELQVNIEQRVERSVEEILQKRMQAGKTALAGRAAVLAASRTRRGNHPFREGINPQFATTNSELMKQAKAEFKAFCAAHDEAKESYIAGNTGVYFPHGTYGYHELLRVNVRKGGVAG